MPAHTFQAPLPIPVQGYRPDLSPRDIGALGLYQAQNWMVRDGIMQPRPGFSQGQGVAFSQRVEGFTQYIHTDGNTRVVLGTTVGWRQVNSATNNWDDITGNALTGSGINQQVFRVFHRAGISHLIGCNGKDTPKKWDGTAATYSDMAGTPPVSKAMLTLASRIILLNLVTGGAGATASPVGYDTSSQNDFDTGWGTVQFGLLNDTPGPVVGGMEFGNLQGAIYKRDAIVMAIAQASTSPFRFEWRVTNVAGPASPLSIVPLTENLHAYLGQDGAVYLFDGVNARSIGYHIQKHILATGDIFSFDRAWGAWDFERQELWFGYPETGSAEVNIVSVINLVTGTMEQGVQNGALWPQRFDLAAIKPVMGAKLRVTSSITWSGASGTWQDQTKTWAQFDTQLRRMVLADLTAGRVFNDQSFGDGPSATPFASYFETGLSDLSGQQPGQYTSSPVAFRWKIVKSIDNYFGQTIGSQNVTVKVGSSDFGEARVLSSGQTYDLSQVGWKYVGARVSGRLLSYRLEATVSNQILWYGAEASVALGQKR